MSCLNLRLPPARKAWKSFTSKIQSKLHKLNKPKAIRKPRNPLKLKSSATSASTTSSRPHKFLELRFRRKRCLVSQSSKHLRFLNNYPAPVYVDKLFKEHAVSEHHVLQLADRKPRTKKNINDHKPSDRRRRHDQAAPPEAAAGTSKGDGSVSSVADDDVWESLAFASPQMHGIDERAEEFITRFRAQMEVQEMLARNL